MHLYGIGFVVTAGRPYRDGVQGVRGPLAHARLIPYEVSRQVLATSMKLVSTAKLRTQCVGRLALFLCPKVGPGNLGAQWGPRAGA